MAAAARVFAGAVARLHQGGHHRRDVAGVDQVVERDRQVGIGHEVVAVMDDHERAGGLGGIARRQIDPLGADLVEDPALDPDRLDAPRRRTAWRAPGRPGIAEGAADRVLAEGIARPRRVARIDDPFLAAVPADRQLVFESPVVLHGQPQQPEIGAVEPCEGHAVGGAMDETHEFHPLGPAPPGEGSGPRLYKREILAQQEFGHRLRRAFACAHPRDGGMLAHAADLREGRIGKLG